MKGITGTGSARQPPRDPQRNEKNQFSGDIGLYSNGLIQAFVRLSPADGTCIDADLVF